MSGLPRRTSTFLLGACAALLMAVLPAPTRAQQGGGGDRPSIFVRAVVFDVNGTVDMHFGLLGLTGEPAPDPQLTRELTICLRNAMASRPVALVDSFEDLQGAVAQGQRGAVMTVTAVEGDPPVGVVELTSLTAASARIGALRWVGGDFIKGEEDPEHPSLSDEPIRLLCEAALRQLDAAF